MDTLKPTAVASGSELIAKAAGAVGLCPQRMMTPPERGKEASVAVESPGAYFDFRGF